MQMKNFQILQAVVQPISLKQLLSANETDESEFAVVVLPLAKWRDFLGSIPMLDYFTI